MPDRSLNPLDPVLGLHVNETEIALLMRAAAIMETDLSDFVRQTTLKQAQAVIDAHDRLSLSPGDSLRVLEALENPPQPNQRLLQAAKICADQS